MSDKVKVTVTTEGRQSVSPTAVVRELRRQGMFQKLSGVRVTPPAGQPSPKKQAAG